MFIALNNYHPNIKFTIEVNPKRFLDTKIERINNKLQFSVYDNKNKLPFHWTSSVPKKYKRNAITGELHRSQKISDDFMSEVERIKIKYLNAGYPYRFVNSVIKSFNNREEEDQIIPSWLFEDTPLLKRPSFIAA